MATTTTRVSLEDKPSVFPTAQKDGTLLKPITLALLERRATMHFEEEPVPEEFLDAILRFGAQAPSGYNLQPWRFIVVQGAENRHRLQKVAMNQPKVGEAPAVIIAFGMKEEWKRLAPEIFRGGQSRGVGAGSDPEKTASQAVNFLSSAVPAEVWLNRHVMIAFTVMMLVAEAYGFDTAPMEGFDPAGVKREFGLPEEAAVVALLAIGRAKKPDKAYPGRLSVEQIAFREQYGNPWRAKP